MLVRNVTDSSLFAAANDVGVVFRRFDQLGTTRYAVTLALASERWRRHNGRGRRIGAVCYHGHLAFMRRLYHYAPEAIIRTNMHNMGGGPTTYRSRAELEETKQQAAESKAWFKSFDAYGVAHYGQYKNACFCFGRGPRLHSDPSGKKMQVQGEGKGNA